MIEVKYIKKITKILLVILLLVNLVILIIFYDGSLRYNLMRLAGESGNIITELKLYRVIEQRDFTQGIKLLNQQLNRTQNLSPGNNKLLKGFIENIKYSFNATVSIEDRDHFESFLKKVVDLYPDIYSVRIWYAQTLENNPPNDLYKQLEEAIKIVSSDSRAYRIGINNAFRNQDKNKIEFYCNMYHQNQLGGIKYADIPWVFSGIGLRSMAIELLDGNEKIYIKNDGLNLAKYNEYEFLLPKKININKGFKLHIATTNGIKLDINKITFFLQGYKTNEYSRNAISFTSETSFVNDNGSIILISKDKAEILEIFFETHGQKVETDKIILDLGLDRLSTSSLNICHKTINSD